MIEAIISKTVQTGMEEFTTYYHSKTFEKSATIKDIEDWAKTYGNGMTIFDVRFAAKD